MTRLAHLVILAFGVATYRILSPPIRGFLFGESALPLRRRQQEDQFSHGFLQIEPQLILAILPP